MIFFIRASKLVTFVKTFFGALSTTSFHCFFFPQLKQKRQRQNLVGFDGLGRKWPTTSPSRRGKEIQRRKREKRTDLANQLAEQRQEKIFHFDLDLNL
jgi:hypothetical protein